MKTFQFTKSSMFDGRTTTAVKVANKEQRKKGLETKQLSAKKEESLGNNESSLLKQNQESSYPNSDTYVHDLLNSKPQTGRASSQRKKSSNQVVEPVTFGSGNGIKEMIDLDHKISTKGSIEDYEEAEGHVLVGVPNEGRKSPKTMKVSELIQSFIDGKESP